MAQAPAAGYFQLVPRIIKIMGVCQMTTEFTHVFIIVLKIHTPVYFHNGTRCVSMVGTIQQHFFLLYRNSSSS